MIEKKTNTWLWSLKFVSYFDKRLNELIWCVYRLFLARIHVLVDVIPFDVDASKPKQQIAHCIHTVDHKFFDPKWFEQEFLFANESMDGKKRMAANGDAFARWPNASLHSPFTTKTKMRKLRANDAEMKYKRKK